MASGRDKRRDGRRELPSSLPTLWRSMSFAYRAEPALLIASLVLTVAATVPDAFFALWLKLLGDGVVDGQRSAVLAACAGLAGSATVGWWLRMIGGRVHRRFRMHAAVALEAHVARLQATVTTIEHQERPEYLDRLAVLRDAVFHLDHMYGQLFSTMGALLRLLITIGLLMSIHPALACLGLFAVPTVVVSSWRPGVQRAVEEEAAEDLRRARHLFELATTASPGKEVRLAGIAARIADQRRDSWAAWYRPVAHTRWVSSCWQAAAWALFGAAYVGAIVFVTSGLDAPAGDVLLVLAAGSRLSQYVGTTVGEANFLRMWLDASQRLVWLEQYAEAQRDRADQPAPDRLDDGIRFEHVSFRYPGTERDVLDDVSLHLPAGAVVAVVGENGAGKTTLVKLLCRFYEPTIGRITVDGADLSRVRAEDWRARMAGAFQDFFRFELPARHTVGVGDIDRIDEPAAVATAIERAGAVDVVERLEQGLETQLGPTWPDGVELSFGQWQKLALARGLMRDRPLVLVLDEPTAALDAETEHALFERFAAGSRSANDDGRVTILVSHRFSTVRMADLIVVLDGARVVEAGSHDELVAKGGTYAELYGIQASAYR